MCPLMKCGRCSVIIITAANTSYGLGTVSSIPGTLPVLTPLILTHPIRDAPLYAPFYRGGNYGTESLSNFPKVT